MKTSPCWRKVSLGLGCWHRSLERFALSRPVCSQHGLICQTYLGTVLSEERRGVHSICDGASDPGEPVEDHRGFIGVSEEDLAEDIEDDGENDEGSEANSDLLAQGEFLELLCERMARKFLKETHGWACRREVATFRLRFSKGRK